MLVRVFTSSTPDSSILVPGNNFFGAVMNLSMIASSQTMSAFRRSSEYANPATEAGFRADDAIEVQRQPVYVGLCSLVVVVARRAGCFEKPSVLRQILRPRCIALAKNSGMEDGSLKNRSSEHGRIRTHHSDPFIRR